MSFQARWRELKKAVWTSKRPTGLSVDFTYLKPGKTINDVEGEDVFVGEEALMKYLDKIDLGKTPRNLDPDFEEAHDSSDSSNDSEDENQSETNARQPGVEEESKEDSQINKQSTVDVNHVAANDDPSEFAVLESDAENVDGDDKGQPGDATDDGAVQLPVPPEMRFDDRLLSSLGGVENSASGVVPGNFLKEMGVNGWSELATHTPYDYLQEPRGDSGPTPRALAAASTPSGAMFYFLQPRLWEDITAESTDYFSATIDERVEGQHPKQVARERKHREYKAKSREAIREEVLKAPPIEARELPNDDPAATKDRAWKLRPVIDALQERFAAGFTLPAIMSFDEAMLPSRSTFNRMRVYIKDKPHKWGTKLFMLWCSTTAYCIRRTWEGVDVHDQLRLQRYSLQLCIKYKKYYKGLFLGLVDLAIINSYTVFNAACAASGHPKMSHVKFLKELHLELCQLRDEDWEIVSTNASFQATPSKESNAHRARRANHKPLLNDEWRPGNNNQGRKRRTRAWKVCSLVKDTSSARGGDSSTYCSTCTLQTSSKKPMARRVFLCEKKRHAMKGELRSCFDIWHKCWSNGALAPAPQQGGK
uniref:PiggyBac transposable element-derived protein domain-containing protein n=1 Tax=Phytophthora ramorum TaxID=164328 RepID=H3GZJ6_PHYRM